MKGIIGLGVFVLILAIPASFARADSQQDTELANARNYLRYTGLVVAGSTAHEDIASLYQIGNDHSFVSSPALNAERKRLLLEIENLALASKENAEAMVSVNKDWFSAVQAGKKARAKVLEKAYFDVLSTVGDQTSRVHSKIQELKNLQAVAAQSYQIGKSQVNNVAGNCGVSNDSGAKDMPSIRQDDGMGFPNISPNISPNIEQNPFDGLSPYVPLGSVSAGTAH